MISDKQVYEVYVQEAERAAESLTGLRKRMAALQQIEVEGFELDPDDENYWLDCGTIQIKRERLPELRKIVGSFEVTSRSPSYNYAKNGLIRVVVQPKDERFSMLAFVYETKHKGQRCHVEYQQAIPYAVLVCETR